jgi:hypothetical protein
MRAVRWVKDLAIAAVGLGALLLGGRVVTPGLNAEVIAQFFRDGHATGMLRLYDLLVGGGLQRGALLAIGLMPFLSATILVRLARQAVPALAKVARSATGRERMIRITRIVTVALAAVQSLGLAQFLERIPGAVINPGPGFVPRTVLTLTAATVIAMLASEQVVNRLLYSDDEREADDVARDHASDVSRPATDMSRERPALADGAASTIADAVAARAATSAVADGAPATNAAG